MTRESGDADALCVTGIDKSFHGVPVLEDISLAFRGGEIHGLLGQNGSGKSTLVKIITGVHSPDRGQVSLWGSPIALPVGNPLSHGISVIHQDIGLVDELTVFDNVLITVGFGARAFSAISTRRERRRLNALMRQFEVQVDLDARVGALTAAERTFVGVLRVLRSLEHSGHQRSVLILDEPTTSLPAQEAQQITDLMRRLAASGNAVVFISHRMAEVMDVCDHASVLRDGRVVHSGPVKNLNHDLLAEAILGRRMATFYPPKVAAPKKTLAMRVSNLSGAHLRDTSFALYAGEVLGVTGLTGMGQEELPWLISGAEKPTAGEIQLSNSEPLPTNVRGSIRHGVALVPGNRSRDGAWLEGSARENLTLPVLNRYQRGGRLRLSDEHRDAARLMRELGTHPVAPEKQMSTFSGGNQQKVVIAKWLQANPSVLVLDEPTQGVDPGAKHDILKILLDRVREGASILMNSGDHEQLVHVCDRVLVFYEGRPVAEVSGSDLTEERLMHLSNGLG